MNEIMVFIFTALLSPELIWDCTTHDNIILYTDQIGSVITCFKVAYLNEKNKNEELVAAQNQSL